MSSPSMSWCTICELPRTQWVCVPCGKRDIAAKRSLITARSKERAVQLAALERSIQANHASLHAATSRHIGTAARAVTRHHQQQSISAKLRELQSDRADIDSIKRRLMARRQQLDDARQTLEHTKRGWYNNGQHELDDERQSLQQHMIDTHMTIMTKKKDQISLLLKIYPVRRIDDRHCTIVDIMLPDHATIIDERADGHAVAAAFGYIVFVLQLVAHYLDVTLPIAMHFCGARSYMHDVTGVAPPHIVDAKWYLCFDDDPTMPMTPREDESAVDAGHEYSDHRSDAQHHGHHHHRHASTGGHHQGVSIATHANNSPSTNARVVGANGSTSSGSSSSGHGHGNGMRRDSSISMTDVGARLESFRRAMSLLDHNMRYLCGKQNIPRDAIRSHYFLPNLLRLIDSVNHTNALDMMRMYDGPSLVASNGSISGSDTDGSVNSPHGNGHGHGQARIHRVSSGGLLLNRVDSVNGLSRVDSATRMATESFQIIRAGGHGTHIATTPIPEHLQAHHPLVWMRPTGPQPSLVSPPSSNSGHGHHGSSLDSPSSSDRRRTSGHHGSGNNLAGLVSVVAVRTPSMEAHGHGHSHDGDDRDSRGDAHHQSSHHQFAHRPQLSLTVHDSHFGMPSATLSPPHQPNAMATVRQSSPHQSPSSSPTGATLTIPNPVTVVGNFLQSLPSVVGSAAAKDGPPPRNNNNGTIAGGATTVNQLPSASPFIRMGGGSDNGIGKNQTGATATPTTRVGPVPSPFIIPATKTATPPSSGGFMDDDEDWDLIDMNHSTMMAHPHHGHAHSHHTHAHHYPASSHHRPATVMSTPVPSLSSSRPVTSTPATANRPSSTYPSQQPQTQPHYAASSVPPNVNTRR